MELTPIESESLHRCEKVIGKGVSTFIEVGEALAEIKQNKLYRDGFGTFEEYCNGKWDLNVRFAQYQMKAAATAKNIETKTRTNGSQILPKLPSERVARELGRLPEDKQMAAYEAAVERSEGKAPTAAAVKVVVREMLPDDSEKAVKKPPKGELKASVQLAIDGGEEFRAIVRDLQSICREIEKLSEKPHGCAVNYAACKADLNNVWRHLRFATPHAPCPYCGQKGCRACRKLGWVTLAIWNNAPKDLTKGHE